MAHRTSSTPTRARGGRAGRGAGTPRPAARQRRQRDRAGAARAGARGRAARGLRAAPDVHAHRARRRTDARRRALARRRDPLGDRLPAGGQPPRSAAPALASTAASSSTAPPRSPTRGCSWSATARRRAPSAPTGPAGSARVPPGWSSRRWLRNLLSTGEQRLERLTVRQVGGLDELAGAHVVERRAHLLQRYAVQLGPGQPVDAELERVGGRGPVGLPVDEQVAARRRA